MRALAQSALDLQVALHDPGTGVFVGRGVGVVFDVGDGPGVFVGLGVGVLLGCIGEGVGVFVGIVRANANSQAPGLPVGTKSSMVKVTEHSRSAA